MLTGCSAPNAEIAGAFRLVPKMNIRRLFLQPTQMLPRHSDALMNTVLVRYLFISTKLRSEIAKFPDWYEEAMDANKYDMVWWTIHHEPEQGEDQGDPSPAEYMEMYQEADELLGMMPLDLRERLRFGPTYTEYAMREHPNWSEDWEPVLALPEVDFIAPDCYNIGTTRYRTANEMYDQTYALARQYKKPRWPNGLRVFIAENGQTRKGTDVSDSAEGPAGTRCASYIRSYGLYLVAQPETDGITWFWNHDNRLNDRLPELDAWRTVVERSCLDPAPPLTGSQVVVPDEPDPNHPQFKLGFSAGKEAGLIQGESIGYDRGVSAGRTVVLDDLDAWSVQQRG